MSGWQLPDNVLWRRPKNTDNIYCLKSKLQNSIQGFAALTPNCLLRTMHREREKTKAALPAQ